MLVSSLYNIVDQIFIGQGVGYLGNAATNVSYPLTTICLAISLLIGIGSASQFSLYLGAGEQKKAEAAVGNGIAPMRRPIPGSSPLACPSRWSPPA